MKKWFAAAAIAGTMVLGMTAPTMADDIKVGMSFISTADQVIAQTLDLAREEGKKLGVEISVSDANGDASSQMDAVENFIESNCDVIVIQALDPNSMSEKAAEAMEKGIKVIAYGIGLENCDVWYKNDNTVTGTAIGEMAAEWVNEALDGSANVCVIGYSMMDVLLERSEAIKAAMEANCTGEVKFVAEFDALDASTAMTNTEAALAAHPDIDVIVSISDGPAIGAYEAAKAQGKDGDNFAVFGSDLSLVAVQYILDGTSYRGTTDVDNLLSGPKTVQIAAALVNGEQEDDVVIMGCQKVTAENAGDYAYLLQ